MDFLLELMVNILFSFPGAFIRWVITGRKRSYELLLEDGELNVFAFGLTMAIIIGLAALYKYYTT